jgi:hypothetical protein
MNVSPGPGVSCDFSQLNLRLAAKAWRANGRAFNKRHPISPGQNRWPRGQSGIATCNNERLLRGPCMLANEGPP